MEERLLVVLFFCAYIWFCILLLKFKSLAMSNFYFLLLVICSLSVASCTAPNSDVDAQLISSNTDVDSVVPAEEEVIEETLEVREDVMLDQYISFVLPNEYGVELDDVSAYMGEQLVGFYSDSGMVFTSSELLITPQKDNMNDAEGEMSLSHIVCQETGDIPNIILNGFYHLEDRFIPFYPDAKLQLFPGDSMMLDGYTFKAFGEFNEEENYISNYEIIMEGERNGELIAQRIVFIEFFDDAFVHFHWIADLDMDGIPDFLIDLSHKYSYSQPTLFLSSNAGFGELVKDVYEEAVYGC